jgi:hypothetical protein
MLGLILWLGETEELMLCEIEGLKLVLGETLGLIDGEID